VGTDAFVRSAGAARACLRHRFLGQVGNWNRIPLRTTLRGLKSCATALFHAFCEFTHGLLRDLDTLASRERSLRQINCGQYFRSGALPLFPQPQSFLHRILGTLTIASPQPPNNFLKHLPPLLIILKLIKASASRSQQHHISRLRDSVRFA
jgi:hypothetical protein